MTMNAMSKANYFDGHSATLHEVSLDLRERFLTLAGRSISRTYDFSQVRMAESFARAPSVLEFDDGARLEVSDPGQRALLRSAFAGQIGTIERLQQRWWMVLAALVLLVAAIGGAAKWGIPALSEEIVPAIPPWVDQAIGQKVLNGVTGKMLFTSRLSAQRIAEIDAVFRTVLPARTRIPIQLRVMQMRQNGINAMAFPDGTVVMTDGMVMQIMGGKGDLDEHMKAQLAGVLAHEIGHVEGRHSMRALARHSLTAVGSIAIFGDFSSVIATAPSVFLSMDFSRDMERDADNYAVARLREAGMSSAPLADLFVKMGAKRGGKKSILHRISGGYLDSHPADEERIARFRQGAVP